MITSETLDIETVLGDIIHAPNVAQANESFSEIVDAVDREDLQLGRRTELRYRHGQLLEPFMADPYATVVSEMRLLGSLSLERTKTHLNQRQLVAEFITRNALETDADALYRTIQTETNQPLMTIRTKLQGQLEEPCTLRVANGTLTIAEPTYRRGQHTEIVREVHEGSRGEMLLRAFVGSTIWAAHLAMDRTPDQRQAADAHALALLNGRESVR